MLVPGFIFIVKVAIVLSILYLAYLMIFRKSTDYKLRRVVLLAIPIVALILPAISIQTEVNHPLVTSASTQIDSVFEQEVLPNSIAADSFQAVKQLESINETGASWQDIIIYVYWVGVSISFLIFLYKISLILYLTISGTRQPHLSGKVLTHPRINQPFSFGKWIFIPQDFDSENKYWSIVAAHEQAHLAQAHSIDLLLASVIKSFLWFTPAVHYFYTSILENHEFLADEQVLQQHSSHQYGQALVHMALDAKSPQLTHSFALKSNLSKRIKKMNHPKTSRPLSWLSTISMLVITLIIATQVSLNSQTKRQDDLVSAQNKSSMSMIGVKVYEETGEKADAWTHFMAKGSAPILLLDEQKDLMSAFVKTSQKNSGNHQNTYYFISLRKTPAPEFGDLGFTELKPNRQRKELLHELTTQEKLAMYELSKAWTEKHILPNSPDYILVSELDFMEKNFLVFQTQSGIIPHSIGSPAAFKSKEVDRLPEPVGGLDRFVKNIAQDIKAPSELKKTDLPKKIAFEFTIDRGGNMISLNLKSKVKGSEEIQDQVYSLLRQFHDNLIKVSDLYGWKPGEKDGKIVATQMLLEIPKDLL